MPVHGRFNGLYFHCKAEPFLVQLVGGIVKTPPIRIGQLEFPAISGRQIVIDLPAVSWSEAGSLVIDLSLYDQFDAGTDGWDGFVPDIKIEPIVLAFCDFFE